MVDQLLSKGEQLTGAETSARQIVLSGQVQGVGFRPFIYRLATEHNLNGWVRNCVGIVEIHVQGQPHNLENFLSDIFKKKPPLAKPLLESDRSTGLAEFDGFSILQSDSQGNARISVPTDLFLCDDCLVELNDASDRRYHYPFINCTQCGPRYTLIKSLPYDRPNTTMAGFELCPACLTEYEDPNDRRFHAEPIACPVCGPSLSFIQGTKTSNHDDALNDVIDALRQGKTVAVKGIGGYHLMCDAGNEEAVTRLRKNKPRPHKPLAVMFPAPLENPFIYAEQSLALSENDKRFLLQPARPILLVQKDTGQFKTAQLCEQISPGLNEVGMMLPYSPLHHLLLNRFDGPLVATSANISGEPVLIDNQQVEKRLGHVADAYLHHNRPIQRPADDPVYRTIAGAPRPTRTGRGSAPVELTLPFELEHPVLAVGAHMKNVITLAWGNRAVTSPHIGEMDSVRAFEVFESTVNDLQRLYGVKAERIVCDAHPDYTTTRWANKQQLSIQNVFHHHAHASAAYFECQAAMSDNRSIIVFSWDGVGYGEDATLWGGETFLGKPGAWQRIASMKPFYLPGADKAGRQPWRSAAALCWETGLDYADILEKDTMPLSLLRQAWQQKINAPQTSSVGRLFDGAAALTGVCSEASYEGQGAMEFEALCGLSEEAVEGDVDNFVELKLEHGDNLLIINWKSLIHAMLDSTLTVKQRTVLFHNSLAHSILQQSKHIREKQGVNTVSFSGGVFQNRVLTEKAIALLTADGFEVCLPELIPVNDAGISFGQVMEYGYSNKR